MALVLINGVPMQVDLVAKMAALKSSLANQTNRLATTELAIAGIESLYATDVELAQRVTETVATLSTAIQSGDTTVAGLIDAAKATLRSETASTVAPLAVKATVDGQILAINNTLGQHQTSLNNKADLDSFTTLQDDVTAMDNTLTQKVDISQFNTTSASLLGAIQLRAVKTDVDSLISNAMSQLTLAETRITETEQAIYSMFDAPV